MIAKIAIISCIALYLAQAKPNADLLSAHDLCPKDGIHHLLPHEYDCTKFYYCEYGYRYDAPRVCAPGTQFSYELQVCVNPEIAKCTLPGVPAPTTTPAAPTTEEDREIEWLENGCPAEFDFYWLLPHETNCAKFYYCVFGEKVERVCSPGMHFNPTLQVCDWPEKVGCNGLESGSGNGNGSGSGNDNGNGNGDGEVELLPNGCPADIHIHQNLPHKSDCGRFYQCVFGERVEISCPGGLHFNPTLQVCDWPENAGCMAGGGDNGSGSGSGSGNGNGEVELLPNGCPADFNIRLILPHTSDCSRFYRCVFGHKLELSCPFGLHFNPVLQVCDLPENAGCAANKKCDSNCNILPWAHKFYRNKFWRCEGDKAVLVTCSASLQFNASTGTCDF